MINISFSPEGTGVNLLTRIEKLQNIDSQDQIRWIQKFDEIEDTYKWKNKTSLQILKSLINLEILIELYNTNSKKKISEELIEKKFPAMHARRYLEQSMCVRFEDYVTMDEYYRKVQEIFKKYSACLRLKADEEIKKIDETSLFNIDPLVVIELTRQRLQNTDEILEYSKTLEESIIRQNLHDETLKPPINT